jgi:acetyl-CoA synthetase
MGTAVENRAAIRWEGEDGASRILTYGELYRDVNRLANALRALGLNKGDVVGLYMPMVPEIAVGLFAIVKIGAIVLPLFSGYGADALSTRLADAEAKAILTCDGIYRRGQIVGMKAIVDAAITSVPSIRHTIVLQRVGIGSPWTSGRDL